MREPVELHDINTLDETMTTPRTVRDKPTKDVNQVDGSKHEPVTVASRKVQIFCVVLLVLLLISSVTLGVLMHKLMSRMDAAERKSDELQATLNKLQDAPDADSVGLQELQTKLQEIESRIEVNKASTDASFLAYSSRITHLEKDKSLHASEIQDQGSRITRMEIQASANDDSIHRLDTRLSNLETNITADQAANHEFNNTMSQLVMDILVKEETIQLQQARLNALESERGVDRGNIQTLNETIIRIESDLYLDIGNSQSQIELLNNSTRTLETNMTIQIVTIQDHSARLGQLETKMEPAAVNGDWASWSAWSSCTTTCNIGQKQRSRACTNPAPVGTGRTCTGNTVEMSICNESPCPDQTSAFAIYGGPPTQSAAIGVAIFPASQVLLNIGGHYNNVTGQYICKIPGTYVFSLHLYKSSGAGRVWCFIRKNGRGVVYAEVPAESKIGYYESSTSTVLHLGSDDKVDIGNCHGVSDISSITTFTGFLLKDG